MSDLDPRLIQLFDQIEAQSQQSQELSDIDFDELEKQIAINQAPIDTAREATSGPLGAANAALLQHGGNLTNRGLGAENSLLMGLRGLLPELSPQQAQQNPFAFQGIESARSGITADIEKNRELATANRELLAVLQEEAPVGSFAGDAMTFLTEVFLTGKQFKHPNKLIQGGGRSVTEAAIGGIFGATTAEVTDDQKAMMIGIGMLTGAITPAMFAGAGRLFKLNRRHIENIKEYARLEKMFDKSGLLTVGELTGMRGLQKLEAALDNIPMATFGLAGKREAQRASFREMAGTLVDRLTPRSAVNQGRASNEKLVERVTDSLFNNFRRFKDVSDSKYAAVAKELDAYPVANQPRVALRFPTGKENPDGFIAAARSLLAEEKSIAEPFRDKKLISQLESIISGDGAQSLTFDGATRTLKRVKELAYVQRTKASKGETTRAKLRALTQLQLGLINDMRVYANAIKDPNAKRSVMDKLDDANQYFQDTVAQFYNAPVAQDIVAGTFDKNLDIDDVIGTFLNLSKPIRSKHMQSLLGKDGQDISRFMVVRAAFDKASQGVSDVAFDPRTFSNELKRLAPLFETTFSDSQRAVFEGFSTLADRAHRAFGQASALGPLVAAGGAAALTGANKGGDRILTAMSSLLGAKFFLGTKAGTGLMKALAAAESSTAANKIFSQAQTMFTRYIESRFPEMYRGANPEQFEGLENSPYINFNPVTDPYLNRFKQ